MSFRKNDTQQLTLFDSLYGLTAREQKALDNSWAKVFAEECFPMIEEEPFRVLYSDKASRPNTPVNVIIGALILKELFNLSDDEVVENLMLDFRYQYALHTTHYAEQPLSDKSLSRFRNRCYDHERLYGVDLYKEAITGMAAATAKLMKIDGRIRRMDSMMIESNIRTLSRLELLYRCVAGLVARLHKLGHDSVIVTLEAYYDPDNFNRVIYHSRSTEMENRLAKVLADADLLLLNCGDQFEDLTEYQLLVRCLSEQTTMEGGKRRLLTKEDGTMNSDALQNPSDPDATYREKAGKKHRGYVANVEESVGGNGSVVTDYQFETNNRSDSQMLKDRMSRLEKQEETTLLVTDGAYAGEDNGRMAADKNIRLVTTDLPGKDVPAVLKDFVLNEDGTRVLRCPAGHKPRTSGFIRQSGTCTASFDRSFCENCPYKDQCHAKIFKKVSKIRVTAKQVHRAGLQEQMHSDEYKLFARLRNGVETVPSILKNVYHARRMEVRGKLRCKFFFGSKIGALNFRKLFRFRQGQGDYAKNPMLCTQSA